MQTHTDHVYIMNGPGISGSCTGEDVRTKLFSIYFNSLSRLCLTDSSRPFPINTNFPESGMPATSPSSKDKSYILFTPCRTYCSPDSITKRPLQRRILSSDGPLSGTLS